MLSIEVFDGSGNSLYAQREGIPETVCTWQGRSRLATSEHPFDLTDVEIVVLLVNFVRNGYTRLTVHLEDTILVAPKPGVLITFDTINGTYWKSAHTWTTDELVAILSLALSGDENAEHYKIVEPLIADCPRDCRCIP